MSPRPLLFSPLRLLVVLLIVAVAAFLLKTVVAESGFKAMDVPPYPVFVLSTAQGRLLVVEHSRNQVLELLPAGGRTVIAGNGKSDFSGDGGPATAAGLFLMSVAQDASGNLYIADHNHHRIRRVGTDGIIRTIAGTGEAGFSGDGGPATNARLNDPAGVAVDRQGRVLVADSANNRIRAIDRAGIIRTVAGTGKEGFANDDGPALKARIDFPWSVTALEDGRILVAETGNNRIRAIDRAGIIRTIAGTGQRGFSGDGGPATKARLDRPQMAVADTSGNFYIADTNNSRIRRVRPDGTIVTIVGSGERDGSGDGGPAIKAGLADPYAVSIDSEGNLYIADTGNFRVRKVYRDGRIETLELGLER